MLLLVLLLLLLLRSVALMVPSVVDFAPWDHGCCALKLVKLAAGSFEFDGAVADQQPSWTAVCSSTATGERNVTTNGLPLAGQLQPGDSDRSVSGSLTARCMS